MIETNIPAAISNDAEATYKLLPNNLSMNDLSASVHTPTANTTKPPIWYDNQVEDNAMFSR